jgi:hypothetical protein
MIPKGISFADPFWGVLQTSLKTHAANWTSGLPSLREGIGGINLKKQMPGLRPFAFFIAVAL